MQTVCTEKPYTQVNIQPHAKVRYTKYAYYTIAIVRSMHTGNYAKCMQVTKCMQITIQGIAKYIKQN